ncbi:MAG: hypothetical protein KME32_13015 [Mojavia pulchra JT2-VF2]|uniref:Uncharacterized protein n=1 Tax=Mojavia pulchra JT2-VF2 TaxID=287848 RepID=A0A951PXA4_9NOST|nr:hypothetical protein [Mojavia pulchra JT2-VF2]
MPLASNRPLQNLNHYKSQKLLNEKAITILIKTVQSDRPAQNLYHLESQKLVNDKAIASGTLRDRFITHLMD